MAQPRGHVIAIANTKGGVGKSTLAGVLSHFSFEADLGYALSL
jgi:MinD-like ATPase involved in chromosome partitioning or flagellar assembly